MSKDKMPFGKYKGLKYEDIPTLYLSWFVKNAASKFLLIKSAMSDELKRRLLNDMPWQTSDFYENGESLFDADN